MFFCLKIFFYLTNNVDPDEMQHYAAFHLGLHCLQKYSLMGFPKYKGLTFFVCVKLDFFPSVKTYVEPS